MERRRKDKEETVDTVNVKKEKMAVKKYLRDFLIFFMDKLQKPFVIIAIVSIIAILVGIIPIVTSVREQNCTNLCRDESFTFFSEYFDKICLVGLTLIASFVPYMYMTVLGILGYLIQMMSQFAYIINAHGYFVGTLIYLVPGIINIFVISIIGSLGIYMCKNSTASSKISQTTNMNFTNFRLELYNAIGNKEKEEVLKKKKEVKIKKLKDKQEKNNYLQILNITVIAVILQLISLVIQELII